MKNISVILQRLLIQNSSPKMDRLSRVSFPLPRSHSADDRGGSDTWGDGEGPGTVGGRCAPAAEHVVEEGVKWILVGEKADSSRNAFRLLHLRVIVRVASSEGSAATLVPGVVYDAADLTERRPLGDGDVAIVVQVSHSEQVAKYLAGRAHGIRVSGVLYGLDIGGRSISRAKEDGVVRTHLLDKGFPVRTLSICCSVVGRNDEVAIQLVEKLIAILIQGLEELIPTAFELVEGHHRGRRRHSYAQPSGYYR